MSCLNKCKLKIIPSSVIPRQLSVENLFYNVRGELNWSAASSTKLNLRRDHRKAIAKIITRSGLAFKIKVLVSR